MSIIRRSAGYGALLLSAIGLLLCLAGIAGAWVGKSRLDAVAAALFGTADEAFGFIEVKLNRVQQALDTSRQRIGGLSGLAERLNAAGADVSAELQPLSQTLDEVYGELRSAEQWLDSGQAMAHAVNRLSEAAASRERSGVTAEKVAEFSAGVTDALARLQVLRQELLAAREQRVLRRELAARTVARVSELDSTLAHVSARIGGFNGQVATTRASCVDLGHRVHRWTTAATAALTLLLLWFGIAQAATMTHAWRLARPVVNRAA